MKRTILASALVAAVALSACAPNEPPQAAAPPAASSQGDRIISGPAPVPSAGSMGGSAPDYVLTGQNPVPNFPDDGSVRRPDSSPYGRW